jgi:myosin heavy subunit
MTPHTQVQAAIFTIVAAVLHLGNATFIANPNDDAACLLESEVSKRHLMWAAELLQVPAQGLHHSLTTKTIQTPDGAIVSPITAAAAEFNRDSLAKTIYARLFDWLVGQVPCASAAAAATCDCFVHTYILPFVRYCNSLSSSLRFGWCHPVHTRLGKKT